MHFYLLRRCNTPHNTNKFLEWKSLTAFVVQWDIPVHKEAENFLNKRREKEPKTYLPATGAALKMPSSLPCSENKEENCGRRPQCLKWPRPGTPGASPQRHGPHSWFWLCEAQNRAQGAQPAAVQGPVAPGWAGGSPWAMGGGGGGCRRGRLGRLMVISALEALKGEKHLRSPFTSQRPHLLVLSLSFMSQCFC